MTSAHRALAGPSRASTDRLPATVFALLLAACFAAFFVTQRLKHTPTVVQRFELAPSFKPTGAGEGRLEAISFKLSHADEVTVTIADSAGGDVATLVRDAAVARYKQFSLRWNGHLGPARSYSVLRTASGRALLVPGNSGRLAPAGEYRVRVRLVHEHRELLSPRTFTLVRR